MNIDINIILYHSLVRLKSKVVNRDLSKRQLNNGICDFVKRDLVCYTPSYLDTLFTRWPKFSGDHYYPVPHLVHTPYWAFNDAVDLWYEDQQDNEYDRRYVKNRIELLDFCIDTLYKEIFSKNMA